MDDLTKSVVYKGYYDFEAQEKKYRVRPMKLQAVAEGEYKEDGLAVPFDGELPGQNMLFNIADEHTRAATDKWLQKYAEYEGQPMSLDLVFEHGWDLVDLGRFIKIVVQLSG